ncbi:MAG: DsbA family protein [Pseudomonadota bacterium]
MIKSFLTTTAAVALLASSAAAFDLSALDDDERRAFRAEVRAYLLENPEVLMEAIRVLETRQAMSEAEQDAALIAANTAALTDDGYSWVGGNPDGDVTIVEFLDYRCGFCRRAFPVIEELVTADSNIRLIVKEFPILGPQSELASRFAIAVKMTEGDAAYKAVHDALMTFRGQISEDSLARLARDQGLDEGAVMAAMALPEVDEIIATNRRLGQSMNITGTPSFVVGSQVLRGFLPLEGMEQVVAEERG